MRSARQDVQVDLGLRDRVYVLTGASKGLGFAAAEALVADGAVERLGPLARGLAADLADPGTTARLVTTARAEFGRLDGALVSVGGPPRGAPLDMVDDQWRAAFESVFLGAVRLVRELGVVLGEDAGGSIAMVLSTSVRQPLDGLTISNGFRPGLAMLIKDFADELGPRGVRVNGLLPGRMLTDRAREFLDGDPSAKERIEATIPLRRHGDPAEFGRTAAFVLSPAASYVTGSMVTVDGGLTRGF
jgi:3-oxoacyl-[acyl-carrier protein] reductase